MGLAWHGLLGMSHNISWHLAPIWLAWILQLSVLSLLPSKHETLIWSIVRVANVLLRLVLRPDWLRFSILLHESCATSSRQ